MISVVIDGSVQKGVGGASAALPKQWPELVVRFPEIKDAYQGGTINVQLFVPLLVMNPDCAIPPYNWAGTEILEGFGIVRIKFSCPVDIDPVNAWIYLPERSPHRYRMDFVEIIAPKIDAIQPGAACRIQLPRVAGFII